VPELPSGTVTFLFTDIEGSTRLLEEHGEGYAGLLSDHRRVLREAFERHGGVEVDTQGDAFFVAFSSASAAVAAAEEAQAALGLPVRMGIHTGEPQLTAEGYVGMDVHRAARICAAAHGRQVVVSDRAAQLLEGAALHDLGLHRLKDLGEPVKLFQLGDEPYPPLRSLNATNLPAQPRLVGREPELAELADIIGSERTVTLTGPGGSGKTRLALQAAAEAADMFVDGIFWVPLAAITDPTIVEPTIGETIGAANGLVGHIDEKQMLLLLDNLEQLLPDAASLLAGLVERCPNLRLLVTSRAPLRIAGEREYPVEPLPEADAVLLFRERAFVAEPEDAVVEVCRRLEGLPLAVELAAARTRVLPPDRLLARLDQALPVLTGGRRDAPERQQTLRATIEWSYDLLGPEERKLFARLAVFAGSFEAEAAEAICEGDLDTLEALVEHSLVRRWASGRLGMLETIREFALEELEASDQSSSTSRRHAEFFLARGEASGLRLDSLGKLPQRHDLVLPDLHNFRAAMDWAADADPELGLRIAVAIENIWVTHDPREGARRFETLLAGAAAVDPYLRARALLDLGGCAEWSGDHEKGRVVYEEALGLFREIEDESGVAEARFRLGVVAARRGDAQLARELWEQSLEEWRRLDDEAGVTGWTWWEVGRLGELAERSLDVGNLEEGERRGRDFLARAREIEDRTSTLFGLGILAWAAAVRGDAERAGVLWTAIEAEEARSPDANWAVSREKYAEHIRASPRLEAPLSLDDAVDYALVD
jgi:predicted ATPase